MELDALTDDQLVELARMVGAEINRRSPIVAEVAKAAIIEEIERERKSQIEKWVERKWIASMIQHVIGRGWKLTVSRLSHSNAVEIVMEQFHPSYRREHQKWTLHVTGDNTHPPGSMTIHAGNKADKPQESLMRLVMQHALDTFAEGVTLDCKVAAQTDYEIPEFPQDVMDEHKRIARLRARYAFELQLRQEIREPTSTAIGRLKWPYRMQETLPEEISEEIARLERTAQAEFDRRMREYDAQLAENE